MAVTSNALPSIIPSSALPMDLMMQFASAQTLTATGYANNVNLTVNVGAGRFNGILVVDVKAFKVSAGNETCLLALLGSNDPAFGNGNVDLLAAHDLASASSGRLIPTILQATPTIPTPGASARRFIFPFSNLMGDQLVQYAQLYAVLGGTTPSITLTSWITDRETLR